MAELLRVTKLGKRGILEAVSFSMQEGEMIAVMGPSGSGKSTLLYNVSGMDRADAGESVLAGQNLTGLNEDERAALRLTEMGFVFQQMNMIKNLNLVDNIVLPAVHADRKNKKEHYRRAAMLMEKFGIGDLAERRINEVSGGQLQRACICRSMIMNPKILFADEPTGALNQAAATEVIDAFLEINREGTGILMVTHDGRMASMCERILYILDGEIRGELRLGKFSPEHAKEREKKTTGWLEAMGW
ncbi:ABC transporter ATP-binding protein [Butyrivibrio sp. XPD2006]|uniref:ABC transporter ATP-binding protein n=1 Tax=Butyrivibrio sp. XPD2006 TaxID=1280668 RepID=UPI0003B492EB|nr:ABC transporter ATP-binding protein [Butyrivibrio sp. XPD2006]